MTSASRTPQAEWKADEAEFFLPHLRNSRPMASRRDAPAFSFYVSAFLNAADVRSWTLGLDERHREVHREGAKTVPESGLAAMKPQQLFRAGVYGNIVTGPSPIPSGPLLDDEAAAALAGLVPLQFATIQHFEDERGQLEVIATCARYLGLLRRYVADWKRSITANESEGGRVVGGVAHDAR